MSNRKASPRAVPRATSRATPKPANQGTVAVILIVISAVGGALSFYALPIFILLYGGLMPTFFAFAMDARPGRHLATTIALCNGAGLMLALAPVFSSLMQDTAAYDVVGSPDAWISIYGFALIGWMLAAILPSLISEAFELIVAQRRRVIEHARAALRKKWPAITGETAEESPSDDLAPATRRAGPPNLT